MYSPVAFSTFTVVCKHQLYPVPKHFYQPKSENPNRPRGESPVEAHWQCAPDSTVGGEGGTEAKGTSCQGPRGLSGESNTMTSGKWRELAGVGEGEHTGLCTLSPEGIHSMLLTEASGLGAKNGQEGGECVDTGVEVAVERLAVPARSDGPRSRLYQENREQ